MKIKYLFFLFFCISLFSKSYSQKENVGIVKVALKHYTQDDISKLNSIDKKKINYYYTESYSVDANHKHYQDFVKEFCGEEFDVTKFEKYRKQSSENWFASEKYPGLKVYLKSWDDVAKKYQEIENKK